MGSRCAVGAVQSDMPVGVPVTDIQPWPGPARTVWLRSTTGLGEARIPGMGICGVMAVAVVAPDLAWRLLPPAVHTAWMSQPCRWNCMNAASTSYAAVRMMPVGQLVQ